MKSEKKKPMVNSDKSYWTPKRDPISLWNNRKKMNKKGQAFLIGILIAIMALLIFVSTPPAVKETINQARGCSYLNCNGYVDNSASGDGCTGSNQTYMSTLEEDIIEKERIIDEELKENAKRIQND